MGDKAILARSSSTSPRSDTELDSPRHPDLTRHMSWPNTSNSLKDKLEDLKLSNVSEMTEVQSLSGKSILEDDEEEFPNAEKQREIIEDVDTECTCTYAVSRTWYRKWEEYVGLPKNTIPGTSDAPGTVEMDTHNDQNNEYVHEEIWKHLIKWYGISANHHLDRRHLYFKDEKPFDVCMLSPFSGIVEHNVKKFNRFEEIGYIESQLRRMFKTAQHKKTRLWISEKSQVPRFRQLLLRFRMLNDCIHRDKVYILALEEHSGHDLWPTGEPGDPKGDLTKYNDITKGRLPEDHWSQSIDNSLDALHVSMTESITTLASTFLQNAQSVLSDKEAILDSKRNDLEINLEETTAKENFLDERARSLAKQEEILREALERHRKDSEHLQSEKEKFEKELEAMAAMHKIQETRIRLDIGGSMYTTSIQTLRRHPDSMLAAMFSGRHELQQEKDGSYFIDRDGVHFRYILNFLRDGHIELETLPSDPATVKELLREARYYQLHELIKFLEQVKK